MSEDRGGSSDDTIKIWKLGGEGIAHAFSLGILDAVGLLPKVQMIELLPVAVATTRLKFETGRWETSSHSLWTYESGYFRRPQP